MYSIVSTYGVKNTPLARWSSQDVSNVKGSELFSIFEDIYLTLSSSFLANAITINARDYIALITSDDRFIDEIFEEWTDPTALKQTPIPSYRVAAVSFVDAIYAGYIPQKSIPGAHYTSTQDDRLKTELQLTRESTDMRRLERYCLVSANGHFYRVEANANTAYIAEAGKSLLRSKMNHIGILSFENIGEIKTFPVTGDILPHTRGTALKDGISVAMPPTDLKNKSLILVIAGYLHFSHEGVFRKTTETRALVKINALEMVERYRESVNRIDWSTIIDEEDPSDIYLNGDTFFNDYSIEQLMRHPQTFWVVVDTPKLSIAKIPVLALPIPGNYISKDEPKDLMVAGHGQVLEYWKDEFDGEWAVNADGVKPGRSMSSTTGRDAWGGNFSVRQTPTALYYNQPASFLKIVANRIATA